jgi:hypothetical protein
MNITIGEFLLNLMGLLGLVWLVGMALYLIGYWVGKGFSCAWSERFTQNESEGEK